MILWKKSLFYLGVITALAACSEKQNDTPAAKNESAAPKAASVAPTNLPVYKIRTVNQPYPPFNIYNPDNTISGLEVDVLNAIAKNQNIKIEHVPYIWEQIFKNLKEDNVAMVGGGLVKDDFDSDDLTFSQPYVRSPDCVAASDAANLTDWHKKPVALVEVDEMDEDMMKKFAVKRKNIHHVRSQYQGLQQVMEGKVATVMSDCAVLRYYNNQSFPNQQFHYQELPIEEGDESYDLVFGIRKDETELLNKINAGIDNIRQSGELDAILKKWQ